MKLENPTTPTRASQPEAPYGIGSLGRAGLRDATDVPSLIVELYRVVFARKWLVLSVTLVVLAVALLAVRQLTPIYRATATLLVEQGRTRVVSVEEIYSGGAGGREHLITQAEFLKSRNVAMRVIEKLRLTEHPAFAQDESTPGAIDRARDLARTLLLGPRPELTKEQGSDPRSLTVRRILRAFERNLDVRPVQLSQLIGVSFESPDPKLAADIANAVAGAYVEADMDARFAVAQQANTWLTERVAQLRANLNASEQALQAYRDRKGVLDRQRESLGGAARQFEEASQRLVDARVRRTQAEQAYNQAVAAASGGVEASGVILASPVIARSNEARLEARRKLAEVSSRLGPAHPLYAAAESEVAQTERNLRSLVSAAVADLRKEFETTRAVERQLEQTIASTRGSLQGQNRDEFELASFDREVATNRQLYETFLARLRETTATSGLKSPPARVVDSAFPPVVPSRPNKLMFLAASLLLGLLGGVGTAMIAHRRDRTIRSVDAAEARLGHSVIAALPMLAGSLQNSVHRMILDKPDSSYAEAIRTTRTSILLSSVGVDHKVVLVTSALAGEGKSAFSLNLAVAHAQVERTLLIEADMRRPTVARLLGLAKGHPGLAQLIDGKLDVTGAIQRAPGSDLHVLSSGEFCRNPLELLSSKRFLEILSKLRSVYETIIIDSPPLSLVSDASLIAVRSDAVLFVVRAESTPVRVVRDVLHGLEKAGVPLLGLIVNGLDFERAYKYYGESRSHSADGYGGYSAKKAGPAN